MLGEKTIESYISKSRHNGNVELVLSRKITRILDKKHVTFNLYLYSDLTIYSSSYKLGYFSINTQLFPINEKGLMNIDEKSKKLIKSVEMIFDNHDEVAFVDIALNPDVTINGKFIKNARLRGIINLEE